MRSRDQPGLRFGLSRHSSVVTSVPVPSTAMAPPSSTISERAHGRPRWSHSRPAIVASSSHGGNFPPHALNPNCTPRPSSRKIGPLSRSHESSIGASQTSTFAVSTARASGPSPGRQTIRTGSNAAIALATPALSRRAPARRPSHSSRRHGQAISVRSCGVHSAGMRTGRSPTAAGMRKGMGAVPLPRIRALTIDRTRAAGLAVLGVGVALRVWAMVAWSPAFMGWPDAKSYLDVAHGELFSNVLRPAGYPLFLRSLDGLHASLGVVVGVNHALGLATAVLLFAIVRRLGAPPLLGL